MDWSLDYCVVSLLTFFILKSILSDMNVTFPAFFWFSFAWNIFLHPLIFSLFVSLGLKWVSLYISSWWDLICSILCSIFIRLFVVLPSVRILHILWLQVICHIYIYLSISMSIYLCISGFQTFFLKLWIYMNLYRYSKACFSDIFLHTVLLISCYINCIS